MTNATRLAPLFVAAVLTACTAAAADPRSQLERNLDIPVAKAGEIPLVVLAYLKDTKENDRLTEGEKARIRARILDGHYGFIIGR